MRSKLQYENVGTPVRRIKLSPPLPWIIFRKEHQNLNRYYYNWQGLWKIGRFRLHAHTFIATFT